MLTRDKKNYNKKFYHFFDAFNLTKLLFKTPIVGSDDHLISRYHINYPLSVKNPLTNEIIVGEVEFFLLKKTS